MAKEYIYVKLTKEWGGFSVGDVVRFGYSKGQARIDAGEGIEVEKQKAVNDPAPQISKKPKVETSTAPPPKETETAEITPKIESKESVKREEAPKEKKKRRGRPRKAGD